MADIIDELIQLARARIVVVALNFAIRQNARDFIEEVGKYHRHARVISLLRTVGKKEQLLVISAHAVVIR